MSVHIKNILKTTFAAAFVALVLFAAPVDGFAAGAIEFFPSEEAAVLMSEDLSIYGSYDEAVDQLRAGLVRRDESTTVYFSAESRMTGDWYWDMFMVDALAHTGNPKEGDYIRCNLGSCSYSDYVFQEGDKYYYSVTYTPGWFTTAAQEAEMDLAVAALLDELDLYEGTEYEKIKGVYDYICEYVDYDYNNEYIDEHKLKYTAYAALTQKIAVCQGYASLYYRLMLELGIDCRYISGDASGESHGWNIVRLGAVYYNMDATWDAGLMVYYRYFLCTEGNFAGHVRDSEFTTAEFNAAYPMAQLPYVEHVAASGTTGGLKWVLDGDTGILTIGGKGAMPNYTNQKAPWFPYADNIAGIVIEEGVTSVGNYAFVRCKYASTVTLPSTLTRIGKYGFNNCRSMQSVVLPEGLVSMGTSCFGECTALKSIVIPGSVTSFGSSIFSNCANLAQVTFAEGMTHIPDSMFYNSDGLKSVSFPSTLVSIGDTAFRDCGSLSSVTIPAHVTSLGAAVFSDCISLKNIYVDDANPNYSDINGVLFNKKQDVLITFPGGRYGSYTIPNGTKELGYAAFCRAVHLTSVTVPDSVTVYGRYAFTWCSSLTSAVIGENVTSVGEHGFGFCTNLKSVTFLNPDTSIGSSCFSNCKNLTSISLPANLKTIGSSMFWQCDKLKTVSIPSTVTSIGSGAFQDCDLIEYMTLPASVQTIDRAFYNMPKLKEVYVLGSISSVARQAFASCPKLEIVYFGGNLRGVDSTAFENCPSLKAVYVSTASAARSITASTSLGKLCANAKTVAVPKGTTNLSSYFTGKYIYAADVQYRGQDYTLYSDHSHIWYSAGSESDGHTTTYEYYCYTCKAKKQTANYSHSPINGICGICGEDCAEISVANSAVSIYIPGLEADARVIAAFYGGERMLSCRFITVTDDEAAFPDVEGAEVRVFVLDENWAPLRSAIK